MTDSPKHVTVRLRVPPELRDKINASSEQYNRSMNADMVARLEQSFSAPPADTEQIGKIVDLVLASQQKSLIKLFKAGKGQDYIDLVLNSEKQSNE